MGLVPSAWLDRLARVSARFRPPRRVMPTRAGLAVLLSPFVVGFAAVNSSNNLLFIILGACIGLIVLSGIISEGIIRRVDVSLAAAGPVHVDEPARIIVEVVRGADFTDRLALWDLAIVERPRWRAATDVPPEDRLDARFVSVDGPRASTLGARTFRRRGRTELMPIEIVTRYPLLLLAKSKDVDARLSIVVRPRRVPAPVAWADPWGRSAEGVRSLQRGLGDDIYGLRERDERDAHQRIHALRSARLGRDVIVEREATARPIARLGVVNHPDAAPLALERALEVAQALVGAWSERGFVVELGLLGEPPLRADVDMLSERLALVAPVPGGVERLMPGLWLVPQGAPTPTDRAVQVVGVRWDGQLDEEAPR